MKINRVTLTGADDFINPDDLIGISKFYPFVEWGILFTTNNERPRYPAGHWIEQLANRGRHLPYVQLSAHLCGKYAEQVLNGDARILYELYGSFRRFQINFNFRDNKRFNMACFMKVLSDFNGSDFIIQVNESNAMICQYLIDKKVPNVHLLYDSSGGRGQLIQSYEKPFDYYTGYAGGLSPSNIMMAQARMAGLYEPEQKIWVDMESGVRTDNRFDLSKCMKVLETVEFGND